MCSVVIVCATLKSLMQKTSTNYDTQKNHWLKFFAGIYFRVTGYGKCNWIDLLRRDSIPENKNVKPDIKYWGNEEYIDATVYVIGSKNGKKIYLDQVKTMNWYLLHRVVFIFYWRIMLVHLWPTIHWISMTHLFKWSQTAIVNTRSDLNTYCSAGHGKWSKIRNQCDTTIWVISFLVKLYWIIESNLEMTFFIPMNLRLSY